MKLKNILFIAIIMGFFLAAIHLGGISAFAQEHEEQNIQFHAEIHPASVPQNQTARLSVRLEWLGPADLYQVDEITHPSLTNLTVTGSGSSGRATIENRVQRTIKEYYFDLRPEAMGMAYVEPIKIRYLCYADSVESTLQTQRIELRATEPVFEKEGASTWLIAIGLLLFLAILTGVYLWYRRQQRLALAEMTDSEEERSSPYEKIYTELRERIDLSEPGQTAEKCEALAKSTREYLQICRDIGSAYMPTADLERELSLSEIDEKEANDLLLILKKCDEVKFAKMDMPISEFENLYTRFEGYLVAVHGTFLQN